MGLAPGQEKTIEQLSKLFFHDDNPSDAWDDIINALAGGDDTASVTMSRADGSKFYLDSGKLIIILIK